MKKSIFVFGLVLVCGMNFAFSESASFFRGESDGSDGELIVTEDTSVPLPEDGVLNYTRIEVQEGATLTFTPNAKNTGVVLLSQDDVIINGVISVSAISSETPGPGGFHGPYQVGEHWMPSDGLFGFKGKSSFASNQSYKYIDPYLISLVGGSGYNTTHITTLYYSGEYDNYSGGGSLIIQALDKIVLTGSTQSYPARNHYNHPSVDNYRGTLRLIADIVEGNGSIYAAYARIEANEISTGLNVDTKPWLSDDSTAYTTGKPTLPIYIKNRPEIWIESVSGNSVSAGKKSQWGDIADITLPTDNNQVEINVRAKNLQAQFIDDTTAYVRIMPQDEDYYAEQVTLTDAGNGEATGSVTVELDISKQYLFAAYILATHLTE